MMKVNNNFLVNKYAQIIKFLLDKTNDTLYILELGAGDGRFSYLLQKTLKSMYKENSKPYHYMLDISLGNESFSSVLKGKNILLISNSFASNLAFDTFKLGDKASSSPYYEDKNINNILEYYKKYFDDARIDIPIEMMQTIQYFKNLSFELSILFSDKSHVSLDFFDNTKEQRIESGSISNPVNLDALSRFTNTQDLNFLSPLVPNPSFDTYLFVGERFITYELQDIIESYGSNDFSILYDSIKSKKNVRSKEVLALLKMSVYDSSIIEDFYEKLLNMAKNKSIQEELIVSLRNTWDNYYDNGESFDTGYAIGRLFRRLKEYDYAIKAFMHSKEKRDSNNYLTYYYLGLCYHSTQEYEKAIEYYTKTISLKGKYPDAQNNIIECQESISNKNKMQIIFPVLGKGWTKSLNKSDYLDAIYVEYTDTQSIIKACKYHNVYVILPIGLATHRLVIENKNKLFRHGIKFLCNTQYSIDIFGNKKEFYNFMIEKNYKEYIPTHYEDKNTIEYPCIIKPKYGTGGKGIRIVFKKEDLGEIKKNELVTEYIEGSKEYASHIVFNKGKIIDAETFEYRFSKDYYTAGREEREIVKYNLEEEHLNLFQDILSQSDYSGFCAIDFKLFNNKPAIFEVNARMGYYLTKQSEELRHMLESYLKELSE